MLDDGFGYGGGSSSSLEAFSLAVTILMAEGSSSSNVTFSMDVYIEDDGVCGSFVVLTCDGGE